MTLTESLTETSARFHDDDAPEFFGYLWTNSNGMFAARFIEVFQNYARERSMQIHPAISRHYALSYKIGRRSAYRIPGPNARRCKNNMRIHVISSLFEQLDETTIRRINRDNIQGGIEQVATERAAESAWIRRLYSVADNPPIEALSRFEESLSDLHPHSYFRARELLEWAQPRGYYPTIEERASLLIKFGLSDTTDREGGLLT